MVAIARVWGLAVAVGAGLVYIVPAQAPGAGKKYALLEVANTIGMKLVRIPAGKFLMGSPKDEKGPSDDEGPQHEVTIGKAFYLGKHEVTRGQFRKFVEATEYATEPEKDGAGSWGYNEDTGKFEGPKSKYTWKSTGFAQTDEHPVVNVTWNDATKFCAWLSKKEGKEYRLPTEAEWEYACRAGTRTRYHFGDDEDDLKDHANVADASLKRKYKDATWAQMWEDGYPFTAPVGKFRGNQFGLHDMHGNVWEWCQDWYGKYGSDKETDPTGPGGGPNRVYRGGGWYNDARYCRAASRNGRTPGSRHDALGFRVARVPSGGK